MIPDPLKDWYVDESKRNELAAILASPIVKEAMALLQRIGLPKSDFSDRPSAEGIAHAAMEQNRTAGFFEYPDELWRLTSLPAKPPEKPEGYSKSHVLAWAKENGMWDEISAAEQS